MVRFIAGRGGNPRVGSMIRSSRRKRMSTKGKLLAGFVGAAIPCLLAVAAQSDETYSVTTVIPVPGGLTSFDIAFVVAIIDNFVLVDRTNKTVDVVLQRTNSIINKHT